MALSLLSLRHLRNLITVAVSLCTLPFDTCILLCAYTWHTFWLAENKREKRKVKSRSAIRPQIVLITGIGTQKGLSLARSMSDAGYEVIGADFDRAGMPSYCRFSNSLKKYYSLPLPWSETLKYVENIEIIVKSHGVVLWIPCSDVPDPIEDSRAAEIIRRKTSCAVLAFDTATTAMLQDPVRLSEHTRSIGLPALEAKTVLSRDSVHRILAGAQKRNKRYTMITHDSEYVDIAKERPLPYRSISQTYAQVSQIDISRTNPWIIQEFVEGDLYYSHSLVIRGEVVTFIAWRHHEKPDHLETLHGNSALSTAMLLFTNEFVDRSRGVDNGHLNLTFIVCKRSTAEGSQKLLFLSRCSIVPHVISVLLDKKVWLSTRLYLESAEIAHPKQNIQRQVIMLPQPLRLPRDWAGHYSTTLVRVLLLRISQLSKGFHWTFVRAVELIAQLYHHRTLTYTIQDPFPWWYLYHIEIPITLILSDCFGYGGSSRRSQVFEMIVGS